MLSGHILLEYIEHRVQLVLCHYSSICSCFVPVKLLLVGLTNDQHNWSQWSTCYFLTICGRQSDHLWHSHRYSCFLINLYCYCEYSANLSYNIGMLSHFNITLNILIYTNVTSQTTNMNGVCVCAQNRTVCMTWV